MNETGTEKSKPTQTEQSSGEDERRPSASDQPKPAESTVHDPGLPDAQGLYNPANEKDACGVGFIADLKNRKSHTIVEQGLSILKNLAHRGAVGADPMMGDGCGILVQIPHRFFAEECAKIGITLPEPGHYGIGHLFMPRDPSEFRAVEEIVNKAIADEGLVLLGWRDVPVDNSDLGQSVKATRAAAVRIPVFKPDEGGVEPWLNLSDAAATHEPLS